MISITKCFEFEAAHFLPRYVGPCNNLHGHSYKMQVTVTGEIGEGTGMIADFKFLKEVVNKSVLNDCDHSCLNDRFNNPTAENMVGVFASEIQCELNRRASFLTVTSVKLWETADSYAEWTI